MVKTALKILIFFVSFSSFLSADDSAPEDNKSNNSPKKFRIKIFTDVPLMTFNVSKGDKRVSYDSNAKWANGISVSYKSFGLSISKDGNFNDDPDKYGKTKSTDYQLFLFKKHFGTEIYYQKLNGFFMDNPGSYNYSAGNAETIRPDIKIRHIGFNLYYSFSDNFSLENAYDAQNPIDESGGSFLTYMGFDVTKLSSDSGFIPSKARDDFTFASDVNSISAVNIYAGGGYTYAFVYKGFFATALLIAAAGPSFSTYEMSDGKSDKKETYPIVHFNMKYSLGYNGEFFIAGLYAFWHNSIYGNSECRISSTAGKIGLFAAIRF